MSDPYADALGIAPPVVAAPVRPPGAGAGIVSPSEQQPDTMDGSPQDIANLKRQIALTSDPKARGVLTALLSKKQTVAPASDPYSEALGLSPGASPAPSPAPAAPSDATSGVEGVLNVVNRLPGGVGDVARLAAHGVTAAGSSLYGLAKAGATLAGGGTLEDASNDITNAQRDHTYQPPAGTAAASLLDLAGSKYSPLTLLNKGTGSLGDKTLAATGSPLLATIADVGTNALATAGAGKVIGKVLGPSSLAEIAKPPAARVEPAFNPSMTVRIPGEPPVSSTPAAQAPAAPTIAPTLAQASPELRASIQKFQDKNGSVDPAIVQRHVEADTLPVPVKITAGQAAQDPVAISNEMNSRGKGQAATVAPEFYQAQGQALAKNMDAVRASAAPDVPADASLVDHGQTLIDAYKAKAAAADANTSALYKRLSDANGGSLPLNGQDFVAAADAALAKQMKGRYVPPAIAGDLDDIRNGGPMTFENFENLRTNLAAEGRKAERSGDGNAAGAVNLIRNALEQMPMTDEAGAIKPLADAARSAAKAQFDALRADPAYKAAANDSVPMGEPSPLADKFFQSYVTKGARANVATMAQNLADNPIAKQTIAAGTIDQLKGALKADPVTGNFSQDAYNKAVAGISPKLESLLDPKTAQQVQAIGNVAKTVQTQPRGSFVNNSNSATALLSEGAKAAATHGTNMLFGGLPVGSAVRKVGGMVADTVAHKKASLDAIKPGAGLRVNLSDLTK